MVLALFLWLTLLLGQLGGIPLGGGVNLYLQDIALTGLIVVAVLRYGLLHKFVRFRLFRPIALFVLLGIISLLANYSQYTALVIGKGSLYLLRWVAYAAMYAVVAASPLPSRFWIGWLASFGIGLSAIGLLQFVWYPDLRNLWYLGWDPHYYRVFATLLDPNYVGILLVLALCVLGYCYERFPRMRVWISIASGVMALALLLTYSRSSYLAFLAGFVVVIIRSGRWKVGLFLTLCVLLAIVYVPKPGGDTLALDRYDSTVARVQNWGQTIVRIAERPVFGFGFNVVPFLGMEEASALPGRRGAGIDSSILFVGVTTGLMGLMGYLWLIVEQVKYALVSRDRALATAYIATLTALGVHSLFVNSLFYPWVTIWMWVLVGVMERERGNIVLPLVRHAARKVSLVSRRVRRDH